MTSNATVCRDMKLVTKDLDCERLSKIVQDVIVDEAGVSLTIVHDQVLHKFLLVSMSVISAIECAFVWVTAQITGDHFYVLAPIFDSCMAT